MTLEDIGENDTALLCMTNSRACCRRNHGNRSTIGNWFFPNGTRVHSDGNQWDIYRTGEQLVLRLYRRRDGVAGIYRCEIPDSMNVPQTIYIGVYTAGTGEWHCLYTLVLFNFTEVLMLPQGLHIINKSEGGLYAKLSPVHVYILSVHHYYM